jgi:hypothetical protein
MTVDDRHSLRASGARKARTLLLPVTVLLAGCVAPLGAASVRSVAAAPLLVHPEPMARHLLLPGDNVQVGYAVDTPGVKTPTGFLYVRNDLSRSFERLPMKLTKVTGTSGSQPRLLATVPGRLISGNRLLYYVVLRSSAGGPSTTIPSAGAAAPSVSWVLEHAAVVNLGVHRFGSTRLPDAVVARAGPVAVKFQTTGDVFGPQTFLVGRNGSIWLNDGLNQRLLAWPAGHPNATPHPLQLPHFSPDTDIALGPAGTVYAAWWDTSVVPPVVRLDRLSATGKVLWQSTLASQVTNSRLRVGPDGTLFFTTGMPGGPGGETQWAPAATPAGRPLSLPQQLARRSWSEQMPGGLQLLSDSMAPCQCGENPRGESRRELRFALVNRHGRLVRAWRLLSGTDISMGGSYTTPELVGGDPVVVIDTTAGTGKAFRWEYEVLRLTPKGTRARFSLGRAVYGDNSLSDVRVGTDGNLYRLGSSPATGVVIGRFSLGPH